MSITEVDPEKVDLLFERFVAEERKEPPDIDVDFEHERREEVIQHIYNKYGRHHANLAATVICYRGRSAIREVGKVFGLSDDTVGALAGMLWGWSQSGVKEQEARKAGLDPDDPRLNRVMALAEELIDTPRHLSQHVGGFLITRSRIDEVVPVENAAMDDRTVIEWDKDDLDALRLLKVDVLGLGMLSCLRRGFDLLRIHYQKKETIRPLLQREHDEQKQNPESGEHVPVYKMIQRADTLGMFQIESRAQMSMLPRLQAEEILRPRHRGRDRAAGADPGKDGASLSAAAREISRNAGGAALPVSRALARQEGRTAQHPAQDARHSAVSGTGHAHRDGGGEIHGETKPTGCAARWRHSGASGRSRIFEDMFIKRMKARGYDPDFVESCFNQIRGFGEYGFPESHAASFANLVYVSCWMKCYYPDVFAAALLNSQPMGFYAPAQIVRDAREHGVEVRPADVNFSDWDCTLESDACTAWRSPDAPRRR